MRAAWLLVVGVGCWGSPSTSPSSTTPHELAARRDEPAPSSRAMLAPIRSRSHFDRCVRALDQLVEVTRATAIGNGVSEAMLDELSASAIESCEQQQWGDELLDCFETAATQGDVGGCTRHMTPEQGQDWMQRATAIVSRYPPTP